MLKRVFDHLAETVGVSELRQFQQDCLWKLLNKDDVFISYKTGSGKSLCYETYPLFCWLHATTEDLMVIVIEPLVSIMEEQVKRLASYGYSVAQVGKDDDIRSGKFTFLFASPELLLGNEEWRNMLRSSCYQEKRILIVIDEAHTVIEW